MNSPQGAPATEPQGWFYLPNPQVKLSHPDRELRQRQWEGKALELLHTGSGVWRLSGTAGSGVSSLLVDTVVHRIQTGVDPANIMVLTGSKESAQRLRRMVYEALVDDEQTATDATLVRSIHSLAFALLHATSSEAIELIPGAEQDAVFRELLAGHAEDGGAYWPPEFHDALTMLGFARQLRDFLLRAVERGLGPERLHELGQFYHRPMWTAAGQFLAEYRQVMALRQHPGYSASELLGAALHAVEHCPEVVERPLELLAVDDAQLLDPMAGKLIDAFIPHARLTILAGDPDQAVFGFRGAEPEYFLGHSVDEELVLSESLRAPRREIAIVKTLSQQWEKVTGDIRRAHLSDGVPWGDMAVIVRSQAQLNPTRRALMLADIPVHVDPTDVVLAQQPMVAGIILVVRALYEPLSSSEWERLLLGPFGGADPVTLRRLLRGLRRFDMQQRAMDTLAWLVDPRNRDDVAEEDTVLKGLLTSREYDVLQRVQSVLWAGYQSIQRGDSVELVLWELWDAAGKDPADPQSKGLAEHLQTTALRGGTQGSQAHRDLDSMMALFDLAGDLVERTPEASIRSFIAEIAEQELPTGVRDRRNLRPEAVNLLTAHGASGQEWSRVIVVGAQEGTWPALGEIGTIFEQNDMIDAVSRGISPDLPISRTREQLREERRLFHLATTRATEQLLICAVENSEGDEEMEPSRFLGEFAERVPGIHVTLAEPGTMASDCIEEAAGQRYTSLSPSDFIAELRRCLKDPESSQDDKNQALRQIVRLAKAGVPGADLDLWWDTTTPSTEAPVVQHQPVALSPSRIDSIITCPLHAVLSRIENPEQDTTAMLGGTLIHNFAEALVKGADPQAAKDLVLTALVEFIPVPRWQKETQREEWKKTLEQVVVWVANARAQAEVLGAEVEFGVALNSDLTLAGRIDYLAQFPDGSTRIVDIKTSNSPVSVADAKEHPQLKAYQLAVSRGMWDQGKIREAREGEEVLQVGEAKLFYPKSSSRTPFREQPVLDEHQLQEFEDQLPELASQIRGPVLVARAGKHCQYCQLRQICPVQPEGRSTLDVSS
ncbi:UvrD-helicase domain-containing protein [Corynebacterium sp. 3HC-13]|uniref:ATP-dependent DNA helicase n=1 Tax=Corynebacterium poyangense TaxID=2684405 RepID=UPI001CCDC59D|nr:ATP-dependent DNA helicase [Corynebacterium poyangense]MBZ8176901.1 UvrD-helicase domain-containing protein [Corynebacterium poyangense]